MSASRSALVTHSERCVCLESGDGGLADGGDVRVDHLRHVNVLRTANDGDSEPTENRCAACQQFSVVPLSAVGHMLCDPLLDVA